MKVWITKYALSKGIEEAEGERWPLDPKYLMQGSFFPVLLGPKHWHTTRTSAVDRAEQMRLEKLESLERQARKLRDLKFK